MEVVEWETCCKRALIMSPFCFSIVFVGREQIVGIFTQTKNSARYTQPLGVMRNADVCVNHAHNSRNHFLALNKLSILSG